MNRKNLLAIAAVAAAFSAGVQANEVEGSQYSIQFQGERTRAEVQAEAAQVAPHRSTEQTSARAIGPIKSTVDVQALRAETARAVRLGLIPQGEVSRI